MLIVADENIPAAKEAFSAFGEVVTLAGRQMQAGDVANADILLVRSVTRVNQALLENSSVRFVGSATIGTDHIDLDYLQSRDIQFANAPGCNAVSAAEYVLSSVLHCCEKLAINLAGSTIGIIGCGNVGSRVQARFEALGIKCLICDPPRAEREGQAGFVDMSALAEADIVTVHVPLVKEGLYPTRQLISEEFIKQLKSGSIFINTSRGDVLDETAFKVRLQQQSDITAILDVWENEPQIDVGLLDLTCIATPHIAGYSIDGKLRATRQIYDTWCEYEGLEAKWDYRANLPAPSLPVIDVQGKGEVISMMSHALRQVYDVMSDDHALRSAMNDPLENRGQLFDRLRKEYPVRRECSAYQLDASNLSAAYVQLFERFGFELI